MRRRRCQAAIENLETRTLFNAEFIFNSAEDVSLNDTQLRLYITDHEGAHDRPYRDERTGRAKVGFGFDLKRRGARELLETLGLDQRQLLREARTEASDGFIGTIEQFNLFDADLAIALDATRETFPDLDALSHRQQVALVDIAYTSGVKQLRKLRKAVESSVESGDWKVAADAVEQSRFARGGRVAEDRVADALVLIQSPADAGSPGPSPSPTPEPTPTPTPSPTPIPAPLAAPLVEPATDGRHGVRVAAGQVTLPDGRTVDVAGGVLDVDVPEIKPHTKTFTNPASYGGQAEGVRWPDWSVNLVPSADTLVLGGLYRAIVPSSVVVKNPGGEVLTRDVDYKLNETWGQVLELNGRMSEAGEYTVNYRAVKQRLDLVQVLPDGSVSLKRGTTAQLCPALPEPDAGAVGLAGVYVFTLDGAKDSGFELTARDILPINPATPVLPINPDAIPTTLAKLRSGGDVNIAFFGDSITDGAEAGNWWEDRSQTYTSLVVDGLRARFPDANVTGTLASQGGRGATDSQDVFQQRVLDPHNAGTRVDLVVIAMGMNDKGKPTLDPFKAAMNEYIDKARAAGIEVLLVTPMQSNPYYEPAQTDRVPRARIAEAILEVAGARDATAVDVHTEWNNMSTRGILPFSQLHNTFNHPAGFGMRLYADAILRAFPTV